MRLSKVIVAIILFCGTMSAEQKHRVKRAAGFVPDGATAVKIAEAVLVPIYGEAQIARERPFHATLNGKTWVVRGTLPPGDVGGVALAEISKEDARILRISHGK
jgi:NTF2 fold immunity protein